MQSREVPYRCAPSDRAMNGSNDQSFSIAGFVPSSAMQCSISGPLGDPVSLVRLQGYCACHAQDTHRAWWKSITSTIGSCFCSAMAIVRGGEWLEGAEPMQGSWTISASSSPHEGKVLGRSRLGRFRDFIGDFDSVIAHVLITGGVSPRVSRSSTLHYFTRCFSTRF